MLLLHCCADAHCRLDAGGETQPLHRRGQRLPSLNSMNLNKEALMAIGQVYAKGKASRRFLF